MTGPDFRLLDRFYQLGYVVSDIDRTVARLQAYGIDRIDLKHDIVRPGGSGTIRHSAKAWAGKVLLELIQPVTDRPSLYDAPMPERQGAFLHHLGCDVPDSVGWQTVREALDGRGLDIAVINTIPNTLSYAYARLQPAADQFIEHVQLIDRSFYDAVPHNPFGTALDGLFQLAFVARDLDAAMAAFAACFDIPRYAELRGLAEADPRSLTRRIALARVGPMMIELIEPNLAMPSPYAGSLPPSGAEARFHHLGLLVEGKAAWDAAAETARRLGLPIIFAREVPGFRILLVDARADLGHYLEYLEVLPEGRARFDAIPG